MSWVEEYFTEGYTRENNMQGYTFEVTNNKTGETYLGKRYAVSFDKNYFGEDVDNKLAVAIEKYGRPSFSVKMLMPYETVAAVDEAFANMKPQEKAEPKEEPKEEPVEVKAPTRRRSKKKSEAE